MHLPFSREPQSFLRPCWKSCVWISGCSVGYCCICLCLGFVFRSYHVTAVCVCVGGGIVNKSTCPIIYIMKCFHKWMWNKCDCNPVIKILCYSDLFLLSFGLNVNFVVFGSNVNTDLSVLFYSPNVVFKLISCLKAAWGKKINQW